MSHASPLPVLFVELNLDGTIGGSYQSLLDIVRNIDRARIEPHVLFYSQHELGDAFDEVSKTYYMPERRGLVFRRDLPGFASSLLNVPILGTLLLAFQKLLNFFLSILPEFFDAVAFVKRSGAKVVHLNNAPSRWIWFLAAKLNGTRATAHLRGEYVLGFLNALLARRFDRIVAISTFVAEYLKVDGKMLSNVRVLLNGIDVESFLNGADRTERPVEVDPSRFVMVLAGNLREWKGQHVAVEALAKLENVSGVQLLLIGEVAQTEEGRNYKKRVEDLVSELHLENSVTITGYRRNVLDYMLAADVVLHTSIEPEPLGRVILEAGVLGKPVIATAHGGPLELVEDQQTGILVEPNNADALALALEVLRGDSGRAQRMGEAAQLKITKEHDIHGYCSELATLLSA